MTFQTRNLSKNNIENGTTERRKNRQRDENYQFNNIHFLELKKSSTKIIGQYITTNVSYNITFTIKLLKSQLIMFLLLLKMSISNVK